MAVGTVVRTKLGRWEAPAAELYRSIFINLDDLAATLSDLPRVQRILEIGCGDGMMAERLCAAFPDSHYVGVDPSSNPGRLFSGDRSRATFHSTTSASFRNSDPGQFDLIAVVDVIHHVPSHEREQLLRDADALLAPHGVLALKEWERRRDFPYYLTYFADRYISGDKGVCFLSQAELHDLVDTALPGFSIFYRARIPPRRNNILLALKRPPCDTLG